MLRYSAIFIISALYAASICTSPLPPSFLFTYSLSIIIIIIIIIIIGTFEKKFPLAGLSYKKIQVFVNKLIYVNVIKHNNIDKQGSS